MTKTFPPRASDKATRHKSALRSISLSYAERRAMLVCDIAGMRKSTPAQNIINLLSKVNRKTPDLDLSGVPHGSGIEKFMSAQVALALIKSNIIPGMEFIDTSDVLDSIARIKLDAILLPRGWYDTKLQECPDPDRLGKHMRNYLSYAEIVWEFKPTAAQDPFDDKVDEAIANPASTNSLESDTQEAIRTRGQLTDYATQVMSLQHRTHVFTICIAGDKARIIRWDRSGCMSSEAFDYKRGPNYLGEFLWRYSHASRSERGFDDTAVDATDTEAHAFGTTVGRYLQSFDMVDGDYLAKLRRSISDTHHVAHKLKFTKKTILEDETKEISQYIVRRPFAEGLSPCGRSMRAYLAYHVEGKKAVSVKDTWRTVTESIPDKAKIYDTGILFEAGVPYLPAILQSGDVYSSDGEPQETLTDTDNEEEDRTWVPIALRHHIHHCIAQELALPIAFLQNSKHLVQAIRDVLETILKAFEAGLLHRDISSGNVMLTQEFRGILNDWDHGIQFPPQHKTRPFRTGTWAFMSIAMLREANKEHTLIDDVESCFWLLLFIASRYFKGGPDSDSDIWDQVGDGRDENKKHIFVGGRGKSDFLSMACYSKITWESNPLSRLISKFRILIASYYAYQTLKSLSDVHEAQFQESLKALEDIPAILKLFDDAIASEDWPAEDDAVPDKQYVKNDLSHLQGVMDDTRTQFTQTAEDIPAVASRPGGAISGHQSMPAPSMQAREGQSWAQMRSRRRAPVPEYSTGDKRPGPLDDDVELGTSGQTQNKRAKKGKEVVRDVPVRTRTRSQPAPMNPPSDQFAPAAPRPIAPRPRRNTRARLRPDDSDQAPEAAPVAPLRRTTRSQSQYASRSGEGSSAQAPRRVTRSSSRKASEENLRRTRSQTRVRAKSTNGRS